MNKITRPSLKVIESRIEQIESLDLASTDIEQLKKLLIILYKGYKVSTRFYDSGIELYRGVKYNSKPETSNFLSYPPLEQAKINRASREGQPMFYCCTMEGVCFFEMDLNVGDRLVVSRWKTVKPIMINNVGYTQENFLELNSNRSHEIFQPAGSVSKADKLVQEFSARKFSQIIPKDNNDIYKLTIAIAEKHLSEYGNPFHGLMYPTIQMRANADNFAIYPQYFNEGGLQFVDVYWIEVTKVYDFKFDINRLDWANSIDSKGFIEWKGRLPQVVLKEAGAKLSATSVNGKWVFRDKNGNIIEAD